MNKFLIFAVALCVLATQAQAQYYSPYGYGYYGGYNGLGYGNAYYPSAYGYSGTYGGYGYPYSYGYYGYGSNKGSSDNQKPQGPAPSLTNNNSQ